VHGDGSSSAAQRGRAFGTQPRVKLRHYRALSNRRSWRSGTFNSRDLRLQRCHGFGVALIPALILLMGSRFARLQRCHNFGVALVLFTRSRFAVSLHDANAMPDNRDFSDADQCCCRKLRDGNPEFRSVQRKRGSLIAGHSGLPHRACAAM